MVDRSQKAVYLLWHARRHINPAEETQVERPNPIYYQQLCKIPVNVGVLEDPSSLSA